MMPVIDVYVMHRGLKGSGLKSRTDIQSKYLFKFFKTLILLDFKQVKKMFNIKS